MPYESIDAAKKAGFPTSADDTDLTLTQINKLAEIHDAIKKAGTVDNPMAVAWTQWKALYKKHDGVWIEQSGTQNIPGGMVAAMLEFGSVDKVIEDANGDTIFKDVTLLAEGTWTDGHSQTPTRYGGNELEKMRFEKTTMKMDHDIFGTAALTNEIGIIENPRFIRDPIAKWLGDVRIFPTQNGKDTATLLRRGKITDISSELFLKPVLNSRTKVAMATDMIFMGAATVRQGACTVCKFNEGVNNMTDETPEPAVVVEGTDPPGSGTDERDAMVAALEAQIKALENVNEKSAAADMAVALKAAQTKIEGMEATVATLTEQITAMDHDAKVKELQAKYEALARQPVVHTVVSGAITPGMATMQPIELDSDEFPAHLARDMEG
jgi:hypothetical protein